MGDVNAADFAVEAHASLLCDAGALPTPHRILNRHPLPRSRVLQGLVVDDHFSFSIGDPDDPIHDSPLPFFDLGRRAYETSGLVYSEKKARRGVTDAVVVGAEIRGRCGTVAPSSARRLELASLSCRLAEGVHITGHALWALLTPSCSVTL